MDDDGPTVLIRARCLCCGAHVDADLLELPRTNERGRPARLAVCEACREWVLALVASDLELDLDALAAAIRQISAMIKAGEIPMGTDRRSLFFSVYRSITDGKKGG
jgi:hypothetical protein